MKKSEQIKINEAVKAALEELKAEINKQDDDAEIKVRRLRSCSAAVGETDNYYILRSYSTIVAFIDKRTDTLYDALRLVYGYTATSAKHIAKFNQDYSRDPFSYGCTHSYRYYDI